MQEMAYRKRTIGDGDGLLKRLVEGAFHCMSSHMRDGDI